MPNSNNSMKHLIQFAHPNGFPAKCFSHLFNLLENTTINYVEVMGHNQIELDNNLENLALELIESIEKSFKGLPIIGVGHSAGGVLILIAASLRPELFNKVILIEPIFFSSWKRFLILLLKKVGLSIFIGPTKKTLKRKSTFITRREALEYFKGKNIFSKFDDACLSDYIEHGLKKRENGFELVFSKKTESDIYRSTYTKHLKGIERLDGTLIYGNKSSMFKKSDVMWWKRKYPNFKTIELDEGHLFPLEKPVKTAEIINKILMQNT